MSYALVAQNYDSKLSELQTIIGKSAIIVGFFVNEAQKWNGDGLYKLFLSDKRFCPIIFNFASVLTNPYSDYQNTEDFFTTRGYEAINIDIESLASLKEWSPDIAFYQQPWFFKDCPVAHPANLSSSSLTFYCPYGIGGTMSEFGGFAQCESFLKSLFKHFVFNAEIDRQYKELGCFNTLATGHPKLDAYEESGGNNLYKNQEKIKIIYAPHHSFETGFQEWATFRWNGREILKLAQDSQRETEWIFKPHPGFLKKVARHNVMSQSEAERYFNDFAEIGTVYNGGDYFDIFKASDLLITDCGSWLTEYLPSANPVIYLQNPNSSRDSRDIVMRQSSQHYYKASNLPELFSAYEMLANKREDPLKAERIKDIKKYIQLGASRRIYNYILELLENNYSPTQ
jgi:hypothetical protein